MDAAGRHHIRTDQRDQRCQCGRAGADRVSEGGDIEIDALARIGIALSVQRLVVTELAGQDHGQQVRSRSAARDGMEWGWWLRDGLAGAAGELLAHRLHHLPLAWDDFERLGDRLAKLGQPAATTRTRRRTGNNHAFPRQMFRQWRACRSAT
jgi:hypothetical protein